MRRRTLLTTLLAGALLAALMVPGVSEAAPPPLTGNVSCAVDGTSAFTPPLAFQAGRTDRRVGPNTKSKWRLDAALTGCTGSQTGGSPRVPGPVDHGELFVKAKATGNQCQHLTDDGLLTIGRRVFRGGESQYRLNGRVTRLKDVKDLLMERYPQIADAIIHIEPPPKG